MDQKHSPLGIASFISSIAGGFLIFILLVVAGVLEASTPSSADGNSTSDTVVGAFLVLFMFVSLGALGLGIAGLLQKDRKNLFAILGTVFSATTLGITVLVLMLGLVASIIGEDPQSDEPPQEHKNSQPLSPREAKESLDREVDSIYRKALGQVKSRISSWAAEKVESPFALALKGDFREESYAHAVSQIFDEFNDPEVRDPILLILSMARADVCMAREKYGFAADASVANKAKSP